jgi:uncharacterized protein YciI
MLFVLHVLDAPGTAAVRQENYPAHFEHLNRTADFGVKIVISGPLVSDDGQQVLGSHLVIEAKDRATAEVFCQADPFFKSGVWKNLSMHAFNKKVG